MAFSFCSCTPLVPSCFLGEIFRRGQHFETSGLPGMGVSFLGDPPKCSFYVPSKPTNTKGRLKKDINTTTPVCSFLSLGACAGGGTFGNRTWVLGCFAWVLVCITGLLCDPKGRIKGAMSFLSVLSIASSGERHFS